MISSALLQYLDSIGIVVYGRTGNDAFLEDLPDQPVAAVAAFTRPGGADTDGGHGYDEPAVQFLVRGNKANPATPGRARAGYTRAVAIRDALHGLSGVTIAEGTDDEVYVVQCLATQSEPTNIGDDPDDRPRWSVPFRLEVYRPTALRP
ncbi:minor capsid protein [Blastococcus sp. CT_GayMR16]|uniref:minor capsid protein n=1 Tax=Blastococcus sp. CT_GayMR16 TaxID=2559607 RepID=UPI00107493FC|nr:minor capsid protein [Blastococcus sp. CT_GayMR16]TFV91407.1 hypothetical protein E4P38_02125 [Blastococcus sp. CT_GayMR16]